MTSRGSLLLTIAVLLGVTIAVVAYDLSSHRASWAESTRRPPVPLAIASPAAKSQEPEFAQDGFTQFALLTETEFPADAVRTRPTALPEAGQIESIPLLTSEQRQENLEAILDVMPGLAGDAQEFWLAETAGMSPDMIREMLALRTQFGELAVVDNDANFAAPGTSASRTPPLAATIERARRITLQNMANANSIGYRAIEIIYAGGAPSADDAAGLEIAGLKLATYDGPVVVTGQSLDIALRGPFLLQVKVENESRLSRFGRLRVLADGRLGLDVAAGIPLEPAVIVPDAAQEVRISTTGVIECVTADQPEWHAVGPLPLFGVPHPENLAPAAAGTYRVTPECGPRIAIDDSSRSECVTVGAYEGSNVNWHAEQAKLERLNWLRDELARTTAP
jgi:flagellar basal body rod protein FlgG